MKILVIGSGGREHAIIKTLKKDKKVSEIFCAKGNGGISQDAKIVDISETDTESLINFAKENKIDLTIVGPEVPLTLGIVDEFEKANLKIFGPNKVCANLEGSKNFCKEFLIKHNIPTAKYKKYEDYKTALSEIDEFGYPVVIKADGLCAGKGVIICKDKDESVKALDDIFNNKVFSEAGNLVVVEEFLKGIETSILALVDKNNIVQMVSAKDHKKIFDNEVGPNTGGMGTFSPSPVFNEVLEKEIQEILDKTLEGFKKDNLDYRGILFVGLMITNEGAKVLEFNVRFGDPETQVVLSRLESSLVDIIFDILDDKLDKSKIKYSNKEAVCVIMSSGGYPNKYETGKLITGLDKLDEDVIVYHSGTKLENGNYYTNGGRVLGITVLDENVKKASERAYQNIRRINFDKMHYRTDIGRNL